MARRKILDETDALTCLAAAEASGMSRRDWARSNGVDGRSLHCWWLALRDRAPVRSPIRLLELVAPGAPKRGATFVVRAGRVEVEVGADFDEAALLRLLRVAVEC
ncbi:MAG: hypothetical protein KC933_08650 [Myxococcales bacterium]|nr:hypothetical protein [Myxococcales bacterium]MCB9647707.1 hypothetical protein [Deltaproteobacteria bacterium]